MKIFRVTAKNHIVVKDHLETAYITNIFRISHIIIKIGAELKAIITSELDDLVSLAVVRSLGKKNINFAVASQYERALAFHSKYCKNTTITNCDLNFFLKLSEDDIIFPMNEDIMCQLSKNKKKLTCSLAFSEYPTLENVANKSRLILHAIEHNIPCPKTFFITRSEDIENISNMLEFPAVLRPNTGSGGKGITFVTFSQ